MLTFSDDPRVAEQQMQAVIWYLTAIGYLDGDLDESEREYVRDHIERLVARRVDAALSGDQALAAEVRAQWTQHFLEVADAVAAEVGSYFTESVADGEDSAQFVTAKLKLRCFELFKQFDDGGRKKLLAAAEAVILADGVVHPTEAAFRDELRDLLDAPEEKASVTETKNKHTEPTEPGESTVIEAARTLTPRVDDHPFLTALERRWADDAETFKTQAQADLAIIEKVMHTLDDQRARGRSRLDGKTHFDEVNAPEPFLDGHVYVWKPPAAKPIELLVIGDLHGCYSCLKAALLQADFFAKVQAHHDDPEGSPEMKLVLLGDYIDRGRFSYNGVLRAAMKLFLAAPDSVFMLRGNHEYYVELNGRVLAPVRPAEAMTSIQRIAPKEVFAAYMKLFEALPTSLVFDKTLFVHAGIPRDELIAERFTGLSSLNDPDVRFQMLWSDPSQADFVPADLQNANARFPFGRKQFQAFMSRLGLETMVRGHERVIEGFRTVYDDPDAKLLSLFSAGGATNEDLPTESNYRQVTPMALTVKFHNGVSEITPFVIDYGRFNNPKYNRFFSDSIASSPSS